MTDKDRAETIAALMELAAKLESNPTLPIPYIGYMVHRCGSKDELTALVKAWGGEWKKGTSGDDFAMTRTLSRDVNFMLYINREKICKRIVVGTKEIPETTIPATEEKTIPAHVEEIVEWACPDSLLDNGLS